MVLLGGRGLLPPSLPGPLPSLLLHLSILSPIHNRPTPLPLRPSPSSLHPSPFSRVYFNFCDLFKLLDVVQSELPDPFLFMLPGVCPLISP